MTRKMGIEMICVQTISVKTIATMENEYLHAMPFDDSNLGKKLNVIFVEFFRTKHTVS